MQFPQVPDRRYPRMLLIYLVFSVTLDGILWPGLPAANDSKSSTRLRMSRRAGTDR